MLLLGPGESGKSTFFKQMKILARAGGYTETELQRYKTVIFTNCISQMQLLCEIAFQEGVELSEECKEAARKVLEWPRGGESWNAEVCDVIRLLWEDKGLKKLYHESLHQMNESAEYFFENLERFRDPEGYNPTKQDVLRARVRSSGIEEAEFKFEELNFRMLDVGGQRSERRKWIHCFDGVTVVLFCASLSEYDQVLREDAATPRVKESLQLFDEIVNSPWFRKTPVVLFLNKTDLFLEKIKHVPLTTCVCFKDYKGRTPEDAMEYIQHQFQSLPSDKGKAIYVHFTCAVNTENVEVVFRVVKETLLREILNNFVP